MEEIRDWLKKHGMDQYAQAFADNDIDVSVLRYLTDQDLEKIGVSLGHRRKMLAAMAEFVGPAESAPILTQGNPQEAAERRQLTVMFTDLVGSTTLSTKLDPEDLRSVIGAYQKRVAETVTRFGGFIAKYMGDGVLVYFGYPQAHEDDAERAVRAGLALIEAVGKLRIQEPLQVRIGVATGVVVVGDLVGSGQAQERGVVGETPNLAARLQGVAEPNTVVIAEGTRRLLGSLFELRDLGPMDLKGIPVPPRAWAALRASPVESRFDALHGTSLTSLVGREEESELLLRRWSKAKAGEGQVALISGEAGIGKSRLTAALLEHLTGEQHTRLRYFCSPQHTDSAFYPIIGQMERAAGLMHDDPVQVRLGKLDALLAQTSTSTEDVALFAEMLSLTNDGRYPALGLSPQERRQRTLNALLWQVEALTRQTPVLIILEDAHWIDPTSLEAFGRLVDRIVPLRVLLIMTFRPEFNPPWIGQHHVTAMTINRLTRREVTTMIERVVGNKLLPENTRQDIIERTDGVPLFVEEMTKAVLEAESEVMARHTVASVPSPTLAVPASLHASLMARLDRLGPAKEVVQIGAVIGREFSHALLASVVRRPETELASALHRIVEAGLLFRHGVPPHANYLFKHALVQDAAYSTLLREPRRALHSRIVESLETLFTEIADGQPELLAHHCTEAGLTEKAVGLWGKAGQRSLSGSALVEATAQLHRALALIATLPGTMALRAEQIKLQVALANALMHTKGYSAPETKAAFEQARLYIEQAEALGEPLEDPLLLFSILYGSWVANLAAFNGDICCELAGQFLALAEKEGATIPLMVGHRIMGRSLMDTGNIVEGRAHYDQAIALYETSKHHSVATRFGQDARVSILSSRSLTLWLLGYPEAALSDSDLAVKHGRETGQAAALMYALGHVPWTYIHCGHYAAVNTKADELVALAEKNGTVLWRACGTMMKGCVLASTGEASKAIHLITSGMAAWRSTRQTNWIPLFLSYLALAHAELNQFDEAWRCIGDAIATVETTKERWCKAEVHRIAGTIALIADPDAAKAEASFYRALTIARDQQAKSWELRTAISMARLWRDQDKRRQARDLLAPVYSWFTEGFDTLDLREAKTLLQQLQT